MGKLTKPLHWVLLAGMLQLSAAASADVADAKPFAEKKVVLQISDDDSTKQTLVLNVASNLIKYYGPDKVDVEIVAFGPGLRLLFAENSNAPRVDSLATDSGVRFSACDNTTRKVTAALGHAPEFNSHAGHVDAGVVRILELVQQGYTLIKP
jgi:intracellular sulfur oxidation DsrE/DsrF family protein